MAVSITIRNVPKDVRDEWAARAAHSGKSLQEYLKQHLIDTASYPDPNVVLARARERVRRTESSLTVESILGHRDADRK